MPVEGDRDAGQTPGIIISEDKIEFEKGDLLYRHAFISQPAFWGGRFALIYFSDDALGAFLGCLFLIFGISSVVVILKTIFAPKIILTVDAQGLHDAWSSVFIGWEVFTQWHTEMGGLGIGVSDRSLATARRMPHRLYFWMWGEMFDHCHYLSPMSFKADNKDIVSHIDEYKSRLGTPPLPVPAHPIRNA